MSLEVVKPCNRTTKLSDASPVIEYRTFPFSKVRVLLNRFHYIEENSDKEKFEAMRVRLEEDLKVLP